MSSVINGRLQTAQGAPKSMVFDLPSSMITSSKIECRVQPYGNSTFNQGGQVIKFVVPKTDRAMLNSSTLYFTGNGELITPVGNLGVNKYYVLGSYYSLFSRQVVSSNGKPLETLEKPGELVNMILNQTLNPAERKAMANTFGFYCDTSIQTVVAGAVGTGTLDGDITLNICQAMNLGDDGAGLANNARQFTFSLPLIGLLNTAKMIPLINGDISVELTLNAPINYLVSNTSAGMATIAAGNTYVQLTNLELCHEQVTLTPESFEVVMANYPEKIYIKSQSYDFGGGTPIVVALGAYDIPINIKRSSLKQLLFYFNQTNCIDKTFGGVNPNLNDIVFVTNSIQYPQRPIKAGNPAEVMTQNLKSYGSLYSNSHSGSYGRYEFCRRTSQNGLFYPTLTTGAAADADYARILIGSNKYYMSIDTEIVNYDSDSLYSGIPMSVNSNIRMNIGEGGAGAIVTPYYWTCYDAIIEMDLINGITNIIA